MFLDENKYDFGCTEKQSCTIDMESAVKNIVTARTKEVTSIIHSLRNMLKDETTELSDQEIEDILLQLPIVLYDAMDGQEIVGMQLDMSNQIHKEAQSEAYRLARGTIKDKESVADLNTRAEQMERILYDRSYKLIKQKFELALETLNAVKKVHASRQQRYNLSGY